VKLIDTNILIYSGQAEFAGILLPIVTNPEYSVSAISHVETLGFHRITPRQIRYFQSLFRILQTLPIDDVIVQEAIKIRQLKNISLGDSLVAATALVHQFEVVTRNVNDFSGIADLRVLNPLD